jgi:hypothetical protein
VSNGVYRKEQVRDITNGNVSVVVESTSELLLGGVFNFSGKFSVMANLLQNDKRHRKFHWDRNCSIQWALHDYERFAVMRLTVQVVAVLDVLVPSPAVFSAIKTPIVQIGEQVSVSFSSIGQSAVTGR